MGGLYQKSKNVACREDDFKTRLGVQVEEVRAERKQIQEIIYKRPYQL